MTRDLGLGSGASRAIRPSQPWNSEAFLWVEGVRGKGGYRLQEREPDGRRYRSEIRCYVGPLRLPFRRN